MGKAARTKQGTTRKAATRRTGARTPIETLQEKRRHKINQDYGARHPERARGERALRQAQAKLGADWSHKHVGTPETHDKAARTTQGSLARLYMAGDLDADQLACAASIARVHGQIVREVVPATVSLETRVDSGHRGGDGIFYEALGRVRAEIAYSAWRRALPKAGVVLCMITEDVGVSAAAKRFGMRNARAKALLVAALDAWPAAMEQGRDAVDAAELAAMQAGLM